MKKLLFFIQFFLITVIFVNPLDAKVFIEIKVNEKIITNYDIKIEAGYLKILNPNLNQIPRAKLIKLAKQSLIKEAIKEKEILKFSKIDINNTLINNYITGLLSRLNLKNEMEFKNALKDMDSYSLNDIKKKIGIELVWNDLVYNQYNDQIKIDKKEILKKINKIDNIEQNSFKLSEIFFELKKDENFDDKTNLIIQSINEIGFNNTANIYSVSENAKMGGRLEWINESSLSKKILNNIKNLKEGEFSKTIKSGKYFLILKIDEIKRVKKKINKDEELEKMTNIEINNQLTKFSIIYFNKVRMNYLINEN
jgi:peptidyl-prolyl cis-trans isomerase SurA